MIPLRLIPMLAALLAAPAFAQLPAPGTPGAPDDPRYCGEPERYANGVIKRSAAVLRAFVAVFPCPSSGEHSTACDEWDIDHVIPLASGGCDSQANLQWLPNAIKSCSTWSCKDRWERLYHALPRRLL